MGLEFDGEELFVLARLDLEQGRVEAALLKFKKILAEKTPPAEAIREAARIYAQLGLRKKAQALFRSYLEQQPEDTDARFQLGMVLFEDDQRDAAFPLWEQVLKKAPQHPPALFYRALATAQSGRIPEARQQLTALAQAIPTDNLYFARARDLLKDLEGASASKADGVRVIAPGSAYKTEH